MTREEAEKLALSLPRLQALVNVRNDMDKGEWTGFDIIVKDRGRIAVGNPEAMAVVKRDLIELMDKQLFEERTKSEIGKARALLNRLIAKASEEERSDKEFVEASNCLFELLDRWEKIG